MSEITPYPVKVTQESKHSLRDVLMILFRRRWIVLAVSLPIIVFAIYGTLNTVDTFTASSQVMIEGLSNETPSFTKRAEDHDVIMSTASQVASSVPVAQEAAAALVDSLPGLRAEDPRFEFVKGQAGLRAAILERIHCGQVAESNILSINYSDQNPRFALMVVQAVTDAYVEYNAESKKNKGATQYYTEQVNQLQNEIENLMGDRATVFEAGGLSSFEVNKTSSIQYMRQMEYQYLQAKALRIGLEGRLREVRENIAADKFFVPRVEGNTNTTMIGAFSELNEARMDLEKIRLSYADSSLFVVRQKEYVGKTEDVFLTARAGFVKNLEIDLAEARQRESTLRRAYEDYNDEIMAYPRIEKQIASLDVEIQAQRKLLEAMQVKRGEVRMEAESDLRVSNIVPLNIPQIVVGIGSAKKLIYLMFAGFLAIVLGLIAAVFVDLNDHKIYSRGQAEEMLELPVLGSISEIEPASKG